MPLPPPFLGICGGTGAGVTGGEAVTATPGVLVGTPPTSQTIWLPNFSHVGFAPAIGKNALGAQDSPMSMAYVPGLPSYTPVNASFFESGDQNSEPAAPSPRLMRLTRSCMPSNTMVVSFGIGLTGSLPPRM